MNLVMTNRTARTRTDAYAFALTANHRGAAITRSETDRKAATTMLRFLIGAVQR
jgi:hypothetical protein